MQAFSVLDYSHYLDYLPYRQGGMVGFEDFRTAQSPPVHLRERKMHIGGLTIGVEEVLANPTWPAAWPYGFEDFRPLDYTRDDVINTGPRYQYTQRYRLSFSTTSHSLFHAHSTVFHPIPSHYCKLIFAPYANVIT